MMTREMDAQPITGLPSRDSASLDITEFEREQEREGIDRARFGSRGHPPHPHSRSALFFLRCHHPMRPSHTNNTIRFGGREFVNDPILHSNSFPTERNVLLVFLHGKS